MMMVAQNRGILRNSPFSQVQSVSQVQLTFRSDDPIKVFTDLRMEVLRWLAKRAGRLLPKHAWDGESFDMLEVGSQPVSALSLDEPKYWCMRISDADKTVARRSWTTETGILLHESEVMLGCRLQCVALAESPEFQASIPGLVKQVVENHEAYLDGRRITIKPWHIDSDSDVDNLVEFLLNPQRTRPVIAISLGGKDGFDGHGVINASNLAWKTLGAAHVVTLSGNASYRLTYKMGKEFSVYHKAVRTYRPRMNVYEDLPGEHPLALPSRIEDWSEGGIRGFEQFLVEQALRDTVIGVDIYRELPSFAEIHTQVLKQRRNKASQLGASDKELLEIALEENDVLSQKIQEDKDTYDGLLQASEADRQQVEAERDQSRADYRMLQSRLTYLEAALKAIGKQEQIPIPDTFEDLEAWCANYLSGYVHVMPRAFRAASKSGFENPTLAYNTLQILRDYFVPMKRDGGLDKKNAYDEALAGLGLEDTPSFSGARAGEQGDQYKVRYNGRSRYLDRHIKGSSTRDERYAFRLYYFWDDDSQQVVVGSFPGHLTTRAT